MQIRTTLEQHPLVALASTFAAAAALAWTVATEVRIERKRSVNRMLVV